MSLRLALLATSLLAAVPALADEVNVYSHRQPELVQPLFDAFTKQTGITVNVAFIGSGMVERLVAEGSRSPADLACARCRHSGRVPRPGGALVRPDQPGPRCLRRP